MQWGRRGYFRIDRSAWSATLTAAGFKKNQLQATFTGAATNLKRLTKALNLLFSS